VGVAILPGCRDLTQEWLDAAVYPNTAGIPYTGFPMYGCTLGCVMGNNITTWALTAPFFDGSWTGEPPAPALRRPVQGGWLGGGHEETEGEGGPAMAGAWQAGAVRVHWWSSWLHRGALLSAPLSAEVHGCAPRCRHRRHPLPAGKCFNYFDPVGFPNLMDNIVSPLASLTVWNKTGLPGAPALPPASQQPHSPPHPH